jgi:hypothetical protein
MRKNLYLLIVATAIALCMVAPVMAQETSDNLSVPDDAFTIPDWTNSLGVADPFELPEWANLSGTDDTFAAPDWTNSLGVADPFELPEWANLSGTDDTFAAPDWTNSLGVDDPFALPAIIWA